MRATLTLFATLLSLAVAAPATAQSDTFYAVLSGNALYEIDAGALSATSLGTLSVSTVGGLATRNDGTLLAISASTDEMYQVDPTTGTSTSLGPLSQGFNFSMGMAVDPTTDRVYAVSSGGALYSSLLVEIDLSTGAVSSVADTTADAIVGLAFGAQGQLFGIDGQSPDEFIAIDLATGQLTIPTPGSLTSWAGIGCFAIGGSGTMYAVHNDQRLLRIDPATGSATDLGVISGLPAGVVTGLTSKSPPSSMTGAPDQVSLSAGGSQVLSLNVGASEAGKSYQVLGTVSGDTPGFVYTGMMIPLNPDPYTVFTLLNPNSPLLNGSGGVLNSLGQATAVLTLPPASDPSMAGLTVHHAGVVLEILGTIVVTKVTNAASCQLVP
jgi:hypothetical protein